MEDLLEILGSFLQSDNKIFCYFQQVLKFYRYASNPGQTWQRSRNKYKFMGKLAGVTPLP